MNNNITKKFGVMIFAMLYSIQSVLAEMDMTSEGSKYPDFIWSNFTVMYLIDSIIIFSAIIAVYFGYRFVSGELKNSFIYVFSGVLLIASNYLLDFYAMIVGDMHLMNFFHHNIFWILNALGFILITFGFYRMHALFENLESKK